MSLRFAVVHEASADFETATELADRAIAEAIDWLDEDLLADQREWLAETADRQRLTWKSIKQLARDAGIRVHGHFDGQPGLPDAAAARRAILLLLRAVGDLHAILLIRDQAPSKRMRLRRGRTMVECTQFVHFLTGRHDRAPRPEGHPIRSAIMDLADALTILSTLADGRDPLTGQVLDMGHLCQQPQIVRALCLAVHELRQRSASAPTYQSHTENAGKPWTAHEEAELAQAFDAGATLDQLAVKHGRTRKAIHGRLYRLGKMPPWRPGDTDY